MKLKKKSTNKYPFIFIGLFCLLIVVVSYLLQNRSLSRTKTKAESLPGINLIFIGDSVGSTRSDGYVIALRDKIKALGYEVNFIPAAEGGSTTNSLAKQLVDASNTIKNNPNMTVVFITSGGNDLLNYINNKNRDNLNSRKDLDTIKVNISSLLVAYPTYTFILGNVYNPLKGMSLLKRRECVEGLDMSSDELDVFVRKINDEYDSIDNGRLTIVDLHSALRRRGDLFGTRDCIHPSTIGYQVIADLFYNAFVMAISPTPLTQQ